MYAIVEIAGQQFKVEAGKNIFVHRLEAGEGSQVEFDQVLLMEEDGKITIGEPTIKGLVVEGKVLKHMRGDKVIVFKKKRKKGYRIKNGHRQNFTQIEIISINGKSPERKTVPGKEEILLPEAEVKEEKVKEKKTAPKKPAVEKEKAAVKKTPEEKTTEKKKAVKKSPKSSKE